jgi:ABC-type branched-subunit amino acid transport system ATPase component
MVTGKASDGGVVLTRLSKAYGRLRAVDSIDLSIPRGETVALLGPNGAGKTSRPPPSTSRAAGSSGPRSGR